MKYRNNASSSISVQVKVKKGETPQFESLKAGEERNLTIVPAEQSPANRGLIHAGVLTEVASKDEPFTANVGA